jgi:hypothetical protein
MSYRTHLTLTARHTGLNLVGTRTLAHATTSAYAIHGASILGFRPDAMPSIEDVSDSMCPGRCSRDRAFDAWPAMSRSAGSPWSPRFRNALAVQPSGKPQPGLPARKRRVVVRGVTAPVVRGTVAQPNNGLAGWSERIAEPWGEERVGSE